MLLRPFGGIFAPGIDLDVSDVARGGSGFPQVVGVLGFLGAQVLLLVSWTLGYHRNDQIDGRHFVVAVGSAEHDRDGSCAPIHQMVHLRPELAPVGGTFPGFLASQRGCRVLGIHRLPPPADPCTLFGIVVGHPLHQLLEDAHLPPALETLVDNTGGDSEPLAVHSLPLASRPQSTYHT